MKTTPVTAAKPKAGLLARYFTLLLATLTMVLSPKLARGGDSVPFKGSAVGAVVSATPGPTGVLLRVLAEGQATHLGKFTREEVLLLNPATGAATGTAVFTAANGDQLFAAVAVQFTSPTTVVGTFNFTGGTGRFESATGGAGASLFTPDGVHFSVDLEGSISSVGANKN
jgi:hypothetical protein